MHTFGFADIKVMKHLLYFIYTRLEYLVRWTFSMNQRNITLVVFFTAIKVVILLVFYHRDCHTLNFLGCTVVYFQFLTSFTPYIDTGSTKVYLSTTIDALIRIASQEQVISSLFYQCTQES